MELLKPLRDVTVEEGEKATFKAEFSKMNAKVTWLYKGKEIEAKPGVTMTSEGQVYSLVLEGVALEDAGKYSVKVEDKESSATLKVKGV